jgi:hypothetical protein
MAKNLRIDSTDSKVDQDLAALQPYTTVSVTVATARRPVVGEDGSIEHAPEDVQNLQGLMPGRELRRSMLDYAKRVEDYKAENPDFETYLNRDDVTIPQSVRDEVVRQKNGPAIANFLGWAATNAPDVIDNLNNMHPIDAAKCIESMGEDLLRAALPEEMDLPSYKAARTPRSKRLRNGRKPA